MTSRNATEEVQLAAVADVAIPGSFDAFYGSEFPRMVSIAYDLSGSRLAAEDLAQGAMIAAHRQWNRVGALDKPGTASVSFPKTCPLWLIVFFTISRTPPFTCD